MTTVATFSVSYFQFLNEAAQLAESSPPIATDFPTLTKLYKLMVQLRAYDTKAIALQRTGKMGTYASTLGQEAISTVIGSLMHADDVLVPFYRDYGAFLQRGVKMSDIYAYWGGDERGNAYAHNGYDLPICVPIASQSLHAVGVASAVKIKKEKKVVVTTLGDGGTSEGDFYEAMNVAGVWHLPVVFVINNNQWAISVPRSSQTYAKTLAQKAIAAGFDGVQVDGNDVMALHHVIGNAIERARAGKGPTLIEALTYRLCDHTTADDASRYRPQAEVDAASQKEPIARLRTYLMNQSKWSADDEAQLIADCQKNVDVAVEEYLSQPPQPLSSIFDYHFEKLPHHLEEQRAFALEIEKNV